MSFYYTRPPTRTNGYRPSGWTLWKKHKRWAKGTICACCHSELHLGDTNLYPCDFCDLWCHTVCTRFYAPWPEKDAFQCCRRCMPGGEW